VLCRTLAARLIFENRVKPFCNPFVLFGGPYGQTSCWRVSRNGDSRLKNRPWGLHRGCVWRTGEILTTKNGETVLRSKFVVLLQDCSESKGTDYTLAAKLTTQRTWMVQPWEVLLPWSMCGSSTGAKVQTDQLYKVRISQLRDFMRSLRPEVMTEVEKGFTTYRKFHEDPPG